MIAKSESQAEKVTDIRLFVPFTAEEIQALIVLIDMAVRAQGLNAAEVGFILAKRLKDTQST